MILFLKTYQINLMKKLWLTQDYFIFQIIGFLMLLRIESCFQLPMNTVKRLVFLDENGKRMMIQKQNISIHQQR